jgi:hypothetical protein
MIQIDAKSIENMLVTSIIICDNDIERQPKKSTKRKIKKNIFFIPFKVDFKPKSIFGRTTLIDPIINCSLCNTSAFIFFPFTKIIL